MLDVRSGMRRGDSLMRQLAECSMHVAAHAEKLTLIETALKSAPYMWRRMRQDNIAMNCSIAGKRRVRSNKRR